MGKVISWRNTKVQWLKSEKSLFLGTRSVQRKLCPGWGGPVHHRTSPALINCWETSLPPASTLQIQQQKNKKQKQFSHSVWPRWLHSHTHLRIGSDSAAAAPKCRKARNCGLRTEALHPVVTEGSLLLKTENAAMDIGWELVDFASGSIISFLLFEYVMPTSIIL